jgi:hypothetical protein
VEATLQVVTATASFREQIWQYGGHSGLRNASLIQEAEIRWNLVHQETTISCVLVLPRTRGTGWGGKIGRTSAIRLPSDDTPFSIAVSPPPALKNSALLFLDYGGCQ